MPHATGSPRSPLTRERIRLAGRAEVERVGVDALSLRAVARSLGVTAAALYRHVGSKRELVETIAAAAFEELADRFAAVDVDDPLDRLRAQSRAYVDHALASPEIYRVMMRFPPEIDGVTSAFAPATQVFEAAIGSVADALAAGQLAPADPLIIGLTMWAAVHGVVETLLLGFDLPPDVAAALVDSVIESVIAGLVAGHD